MRGGPLGEEIYSPLCGASMGYDGCVLLFQVWSCILVVWVLCFHVLGFIYASSRRAYLSLFWSALVVGSGPNQFMMYCSVRGSLFRCSG